MAKSYITLLLSLLACSTSAFQHKRQLDANNLTLSRRIPVTVCEASSDVETEHYLKLRPGGASRTSALLASLQRDARAAKTTASALLSNVLNTEYLVEIEFDKTTFTVVLDTGSSDTWLVAKGFECVTDSLKQLSEAACDFGPTFNATLEGGDIINENFNITYGSGEFLIGFLGHSHVTVAGLDVAHQEVALVTEAYWEGDTVSSGIMGLAYESLTSAFAGTNPAVDDENNTIEYSPILKSMYTQGLISPIFSLALERDSTSNSIGRGGYVAFGGYPPITFSKKFTTTPIEILDLTDVATQAKQHSFYTIVVDGFTGSGSRRSGYSDSEGYGDSAGYSGGSDGGLAKRQASDTFAMIVDSGTSLVYVPTELAIEINELYDPPAFYIEEEGAFFSYCDATPPTLGVVINGTTFNINSADLIVQSEAVDVGRDMQLCVTGVQDGGTGPYILGDVFLQNVVAVFDVGASEMRFAAHETY